MRFGSHNVDREYGVCVDCGQNYLNMLNQSPLLSPRCVPSDEGRRLFYYIRFRETLHEPRTVLLS